MTHLPINDWASLSEAWRKSGPGIEGAELVRRVRRQTRRMAAQLAGEVLLSMGAVWLLWQGFTKDVSLEGRLVCAGLAVMTAGIWAMRVRTLRGTWRPAAGSLTAYRDLERERLTRRVREAQSTARLCLLALPFALLLAVVRLAAHGPWSIQSAIPAAAGLYLAVWIAWARRAQRRRSAERDSWNSWLPRVEDTPSEVAEPPSR
jgi:hypothetical protein